MKEITVTVTREDWDAAKAEQRTNPGFMYSQDCAVAKAFKRVTGQTDVGIDYGTIMAWEQRAEYFVPDELKPAINDFDCGLPFTGPVTGTFTLIES